MKSFFISFNIFVVLLVQFLVVLPKPAHASTPYTASDVIGQRTYNGSISFTSNFDNSSQITNDGFYNPSAQVIDTVSHRLFVADSSNRRVLVFNLDSNNYPVDSEADYVLGQINMASVDQSYESYTPTAANFYAPSALAFDSVNNRLFVGDASWGRILIFDMSTITNNEDAVNVLGVSQLTDQGFYYDRGSTTVYDVRSMTFDSNTQYLYTTDGNRVMVFDLNAITNGESAIKVLGQSNFTNDGYDTTASGFNYATGLAIDQTNSRLFVSESAGNRVLVFDVSSISNNEPAVHVLGQADFTSSDSDTNAKGFMFTEGVAYDDVSNLLYVSDEANRVLVFDVTSISDNEDAQNVLGQTDFTSSTSDTNAKGFWYPKALATINGSYLYAIDNSNNRILIFNTATIVDNESAVDVLGQRDTDGNAVYTRGDIYNNPWGIPNEYSFYNLGYNGGAGSDIDYLHHRLFITDYGNNRVLVFNLDSSNKLVDHAADYVLGAPDLITAGADGYSATEFSGPQDVKYDATNNRLFVQDLYNDRIQIFDVATITNGEAALYSLGSESPDQEGGGGQAADQFGYSDQLGMAYDSDTGYLYVMDTGNSHRILVFNVSPSNPSFASGMDASYAIGSEDLISSGGGSCVADQISGYYNSGIVVDTERNLLFASNDNCSTVMVFDLNNLATGMDASYVLGCVDFDCSTPANTEGTFGDVNGMSYDSEHQLLYVYDEGFSRIMVFDVSTITSGEDSVGIIGQSNYVDSNTGTSNSLLNFNYESNGAFDTQNRRLYFPDAENQRILIFYFAHLIDLPTTMSNGAVVNETLGEGYQGTTTYTLDSGTVPTGLTFNAATGLLSGTTTADGIYTFTVTITDDNGIAGTYTDTKEYSITVGEGGSPVVSSSSTSSPKPEGQYSTTETPTCNAQAPSTPDLFQVTSLGNTSASIHFSPSSGSVSKYFISFGETEEAEGYSATLDMGQTDGAITYTLELLKPYTTYYVKVNATNNCMPSAWSTTIPFRTSTYQSYFPGSSISNLTTPAQVFGTSTNSDSSMKKDDSSMKGTTTTTNKATNPTITKHSNPKPQTCFLFWCW